jgi:hypothetical protein
MHDGVSHLCHTGLRKVARPAGLEPATLGLEGRCSIHLSYGRLGDLDCTIRSGAVPAGPDGGSGAATAVVR